jgi:tRNA (adenine37-N6)-methyltransferase
MPFRAGETTDTFALRLPVRPNPIASSIVELMAIEGVTLLVRARVPRWHAVVYLKPDRATASD